MVVDWEGYTIGYYGRPFQTRSKVKGSAFESSEKDYYRWIVGSGSTIRALDDAVKLMKEVRFYSDLLLPTYKCCHMLAKGGITQVIVPAELGYPENGDSDHTLVGPRCVHS